MATEKPQTRPKLVKLAAAGAAFLVFGLFVIAWYAHVEAEETDRADLITAVETGSVGEVRSLLDRGADPNTRLTRPENPPPGLITRLLRSFRRSNSTKIGRPVLELATLTERNRYEMVSLLLSHGATTEHRAGEISVLSAPAAAGDLRTMDLLLKHGADIDAGLDYGNNALVSAVMVQNRAAVRFLLDHGAKLKSALPGTQWSNAMTHAVRGGDKEIVHMLAEAQKHP